MSRSPVRRRIESSLALTLAGVLGSREVWAVCAVSGQIAPEVTDLPTFGSQLLKVCGVLGGLLGILFLILYVLRKPMRFPNRLGSSRLIQVLATHYLEPKKSLILVEVAGQRLLLSNTAESLALLALLGSPDQGQPPRATPESFSSRVPGDVGLLI